jgi:hypothetical protein
MPTATPNMREIGWSGLRHSGGVIQEEWIAALDSVRGIRTYAEMLADPIVNATLLGVTNEMTRSEWSIKPNDEAGGDKEHEFVESVFNDMSTSFEDVFLEVLTCLPYGWSYFEVVYKYRSGPNVERPGEGSLYSDGYKGWRKITIRGQDTLSRWELDPNSGVQGMWQRQEDSNDLLIPIDRSLLFRPSSHKNNPQGRSILRSAYIPWFCRKRLREIDLIGADRDVVGIPVIWLPPEWLTEDSSDEQKAAVDGFRRIAANLRVDEQSYVIMPLEYDENGNKVFDLSLLSSPGAKLENLEEKIQRYSREIAMSCLADVMLIGHEGVGSYSLSEQKYDAFTRGLMGWLRAIAEVFNRHAIPRLLAENGMDPAKAPELVFSPIENIDLQKLGSYITALSGAGFPLFPDEELQEWLARAGGMPYTPMDEREPIEKPTWELSPEQQAMQDAQVEAVRTGQNDRAPGAGGAPPSPSRQGAAPGARTPAAKLYEPDDWDGVDAEPPTEDEWDAAFAKFNPNHDRRGRFSSGPGSKGSLGPELQRHIAGGDGSRDHPFKTKDVDTAIALLEKGHHVRLRQPDEVATLVDKLAAIVEDAKRRGVDAPVYDLCKVSVKGTNLFCSQSKHVPRNMMPQLTGKPKPGSWADRHLPKNHKGEVDLGPIFENYMAERGIAVRPGKMQASHLRASQNQLNGAKVSGMVKANERGEIPPGSIYVTRDGYVIDGHHRWAMNVASGIKSGHDPLMDVKVVDEDILQVLAIANNFTTGHGIPKAGVAKKVDVLATLAAIASSSEEGRQSVPFDELAKFNPHHDALGRFSSGGVGPGGELAPIVAKPGTKAPGEPTAVTMEGLDERTRAQVGEVWERTTGVSPAQAEANLEGVFNEALGDPVAVGEGRRWYGRAHDDAAAMAERHGVSPDTAVGVIAALSPGAEWGANKRMADAVLATRKAHPDLDPERLAHVAKAEHHLAAPHGYDPLIKASRIASGEPPGNVLTGAKVRSFYNNIRDPRDPRHVTIDSHMMDAAYGGTRRGVAGVMIAPPKNAIEGYMAAHGYGKLPKGWKAQTPPGAPYTARNPVMTALTGSPSSKGRTIGTLPLHADALRRITARHNEATGDDLVPNQTQAIIWTHWIRQHRPTESRLASNEVVAATGEFYGSQP